MRAFPPEDWPSGNQAWNEEMLAKLIAFVSQQSQARVQAGVEAALHDQVLAIIRQELAHPDSQLQTLIRLSVPLAALPFASYTLTDEKCARIVQLMESNDITLEEAARYEGVQPSLARMAVMEYLERFRHQYPVESFFARSSRDGQRPDGASTDGVAHDSTPDTVGDGMP